MIIDFMVGFSRYAKGNNTKSVHFLSVRMTFTMKQYVHVYVRKIVRVHRVPISIASYRDLRFTSKFWKGLEDAMGKILKISATNHLQINGQSERTIQILKDTLKACVLDLGDNWEILLLLIEFAFDNSFQITISMASYETLYVRKCNLPIYQNEVGEKVILGPEIIDRTVQDVDKNVDKIDHCASQFIFAVVNQIDMSIFRS